MKTNTHAIHSSGNPMAHEAVVVRIERTAGLSPCSISVQVTEKELILTCGANANVEMAGGSPAGVGAGGTVRNRVLKLSIRGSQLDRAGTPPRPHEEGAHVLSRLPPPRLPHRLPPPLVWQQDDPEGIATTLVRSAIPQDSSAVRRYGPGAHCVSEEAAGIHVATTVTAEALFDDRRSTLQRFENRPGTIQRMRAWFRDGGMIRWVLNPCEKLAKAILHRMSRMDRTARAIGARHLPVS